MFQSTLGPADPLIGGAGFWGDTAEASAAAFAAGASGGAGSAEGARRWRKGTWRRRHRHRRRRRRWGGFGHGCSLGFLEDVLVDSGERVVEFCQKRVRRHGIKFLENGCLVLNNRSLVEICQVFGRDYVQSVFERPTMIAVHWYENVWQCTKHLTIEIMDFPQNNITLCSVDWKIQLKLSSNQQKFTWRSIKNWIMIRERNISCNSGCCLHVAV